MDSFDVESIHCQTLVFARVAVLCYGMITEASPRVTGVTQISPRKLGRCREARISAAPPPPSRREPRGESKTTRTRNTTTFQERRAHHTERWEGVCRSAASVPCRHSPLPMPSTPTTPRDHGGSGKVATTPATLDPRAFHPIPGSSLRFSWVVGCTEFSCFLHAPHLPILQSGASGRLL